MSISQYDFWYDKQIVRFLEQLVRAFSGFSYQTGIVAGQAPQTVMVPCRMATMDRMTANIISNLSENTLLSVPLITVSLTGLKGRREDLQNPGYTDTHQVFERNVAPDGSYGPRRGKSYSVDRIMPLPFTMDAQVDIWTSNIQQKLMLLEQILPVIYPQFEIQNSSNALDWTAVTVCFVDDDITYSSRTIPIGTSDEIDVASIPLRLPIWLSAPAKVKRLTRIEEIITNINQAELDINTGELVSGKQLAQVIVTPEDACINVNGPILTLLGAKEESEIDGTIPSWPQLIKKYGVLIPTISNVRLYIDDNITGPFVSGSLQYGSEANEMRWTIDASTLPSNTLTAITGVLNPHTSYPGQGLPPSASGQRYLLINDIGNSVAWGSTFAAKTNDIIERVNGLWTVSFNAASVSSQQYVLNSYTGRQLRWTGSSWTTTIEGNYRPGYWELILGPTVNQVLTVDSSDTLNDESGLPIEY